jgi:hypothetical protein
MTPQADPMTKATFDQLWHSTFPDTAPFAHVFKHRYPERWFRIHSLPAAKRYADHEQEWTILLDRQNEIITDLLGLNTPVALLTGDYHWKTKQKPPPTDPNDVFKPYSLTRLDPIDLHHLNPDDDNMAIIYTPAFATTFWQPQQHNPLLRAIANDETRAFFILFEQPTIVAPYDGGIDFILKDLATKDFYKNKYQTWLSTRADGL